MGQISPRSARRESAPRGARGGRFPQPAGAKSCRGREPRRATPRLILCSGHRPLSCASARSCVSRNRLRCSLPVAVSGSAGHPVHPARTPVFRQLLDARGEALAGLVLAPDDGHRQDRDRDRPSAVATPTAATWSIASPPASTSACSIQSVLTHWPDTLSRSSRAAGEFQPALAAADEHVARRIPAVAKAVGLRFGTAPVAERKRRHSERRCAAECPDRCRRRIARRQRRRPQQPRIVVRVEHEAQRFRRAVARDRRLAGRPAPNRCERWPAAPRPPRRNAGCRVGKLRRDAVVQHPVVERRHGEEERRPVPRDHRADALGSRPLAVEDDRGAERESRRTGCWRARTRRTASRSSRTGRRRSPPAPSRRSCGCRPRPAAGGSRPWECRSCPTCRSTAPGRRRAARRRRSATPRAAPTSSRAVTASVHHDGRRRREASAPARQQAGSRRRRRTRRSALRCRSGSARDRPARGAG